MAILGQATHHVCTQLPNPVVSQIRNSDGRTALRIVGQIFKAERAVESPYAVIERMREHAKAANIVREAHGGHKREKHQRSGIAAPLIAPVDPKLAEQGGRYWIGPIALFALS